MVDETVLANVTPLLIGPELNTTKAGVIEPNNGLSEGSVLEMMMSQTMGLVKLWVLKGSTVVMM